MEAELFVEEMVRVGGVRATSSERLVLKALAYFLDPSRGYAYPAADTLARKAMLSKRQTQRMVASLIDKGLVQRHAVARDMDGGQSANEYELVGFVRDSVQAPGAVDMAAGELSQQVTRGAGRKRANRTRVRMATQVLLPTAVVREGAGEAVENVESVTPSGCQEMSWGGCHLVSPREEIGREKYEEKQPPTPCLSGPVEEKLPGNAKAKASTPARANATATTGAVRKPAARRAFAGEDGVSPAADSEAAILADECRRVLVVCGVAPETSTRKLRSVVEAALRMWSQREKRPIGDAGDLAWRRWREYGELGERGLLRWKVGVRKFFEGGIWLNPGHWPVDQDRAKRGGL